MEKQAIYRYLGGAASEPQLDGMIARAEAEVKRAAAPRYADGRFPLSVAAEGVTIGGTYLASKTVEITPNVDVPVTVTWYFNGTYSNQQLTTITASSTLHVPG